VTCPAASRLPDPLAANVVHVREDGRNGADLSGRFRRRFHSSGRGGKMLDQKLVDALIGGKDLRRGPAQLSGCHVASRVHGSLLLDLEYFRATGKTLLQADISGLIPCWMSALAIYRQSRSHPEGACQY
jgi:hypothetical protein